MNDKLKHFFACAGIAVVTGLLIDPRWGFLTVALAAGGKELIWDYLLKRGTPEVADITASLMGGWLATIVMCVIRLGL